MARIAGKGIALIVILVISMCRTPTIPKITDSRDHILYTKTVVTKSGVLDENIWIIDVNSLQKYQFTHLLHLIEVFPEWLSESTFVYLVRRQSSGYRSKAVIVDIKHQTYKVMDWWKGRQSDQPLGVTGGFVYHNGYIYYANMSQMFRLNLQTGELSNVIPYYFIRKEDIKDIWYFSISENDIIAFNAENSTQEQLARRTKFKKFATDIYLFNLCTTELKRLTYGDTLISYEYPVWVGNDTLILSSNQGDTNDLYLMDLNTMKMTKLINTPDVEEQEITLSPNHDRIAYVKFNPKCNDFDKNTEIWLMDLKTKETHFLDYGDQPRWSPAK